MEGQVQPLTLKEDLDIVLVYAPQFTPRMEYIFHELFPSVSFTTSRESFTAWLGVKICYAHERICNNVLWVVPHALLLQQNIREQEIDCGVWRNKKIFFRTPGDIPFDVFAASFYLLCRYEEYLPHEKDQYGRYAHTNSIAYKEAFLNIPLIDEWMMLVEDELRERCSRLRFRLPSQGFSFVPTYDVDEAFSYRHKPLWKNLFGFFRDLLMGKLEEVIERGNVYSGRKPDPYDTFGWIEDLHRKRELKPIWFFLTIVKPGTYDKNLNARSQALQALYKRLSTDRITGLHPSWQSGTEEHLLEKELLLLQRIVHKPVTISRHHYLRFTIPQTFRRLIAAGITDDYSMAYGTINGFRASRAKSFLWYDLESEQCTGLRIHPFCFMDATAAFNEHLSVEEAARQLQYFHDTVKRVKGECITLFHNHFLTEQPQWIQWRTMYESFLHQNFSHR